MSSAVLRLWKEYQHLSEEDRHAFFSLVREEPEKPSDFLEPRQMAPEGRFAGIDTPEEIAEQNEFAKHSVIEVPHDLE